MVYCESVLRSRGYLVLLQNWCSFVKKKKNNKHGGMACYIEGITNALSFPKSGSMCGLMVHPTRNPRDGKIMAC